MSPLERVIIAFLVGAALTAILIAMIKTFPMIWKEGEFSFKVLIVLCILMFMAVLVFAVSKGLSYL